MLTPPSNLPEGGEGLPERRALVGSGSQISAPPATQSITPRRGEKRLPHGEGRESGSNSSGPAARSGLGMRLPRHRGSRSPAGLSCRYSPTILPSRSKRAAEGQLQAPLHIATQGAAANPQGYQAPSFREGCLMGPKCADTCHAGRPQAAILWFHRGMSPPPEIDDFAPLEANCSIFK